MAEGKWVSYLRVSTGRQGRSGSGLEAHRAAVAHRRATGVPSPRAVGMPRSPFGRLPLPIGELAGARILPNISATQGRKGAKLPSSATKPRREKCQLAETVPLIRPTDGDGFIHRLWH
jgi:hypothetical protein